MGITSDLLKVSVRGQLLAQRVEVVQYFVCGGAGLLTASCANVAEAFWNYVKTEWRASHGTADEDRTLSVFVEEVGGSLGFGEYAIPSDEQLGTRVITSLGDLLPPFAAVGARLTIATRVTRPGQKRFWGLFEHDSNNGLLDADVRALVEDLLDKWTLPIGLSTPADVVGLNAYVVRLNRETGAVVTRQAVTGYLVSPYVTTQNSRKYGRGV